MVAFHTHGSYHDGDDPASLVEKVSWLNSDADTDDMVDGNNHGDDSNGRNVCFGHEERKNLDRTEHWDRGRPQKAFAVILPS